MSPQDRQVSAKGTGIDSLIMTYDNTGNIISKTDVGDYSYHSQKVHAVESIEPVEPLSVFGDQRISYNYMNLPIYIASDEDSLVYTYGVGNKRIKAMQYSGGQLVRTTWYGDGFERVVEGSTEKFYHWIQSPDGPVALVIKVTGGATTNYYLCTDHLSSITGIMDASGNMQEEYSYDPWGRRRSPVNWSTNSLTAPVITTRGYTGHEHLDAFGLIHMNGRIYDPHLARVLNPDPIIQDPTDIQNYNRYSYCLNNPLKYTDPSGYISYKQFMDNTYGEGNYYYRGRGPKLLSYEEYMSSGNGGRGGVGGPFGLPYQGDNGSGDLGFYFDYYSRTYRNTETGTQMPNITHLVYTYGPNLPTIFRGVLFQNGTSWYTEDGPYPAGQGGNLGTYLGYVNDGFNAFGTVAGGAELFTQANAGARITYTTLNGASSWVSSAKVVSTFKAVGTYTVVGSVVVDLTLGATGYQTPGKTVTSIGVAIGAWAIGGIPGIVIGVGYTILDRTGCLDGPTGPMPYYNPPIIIMPDATRVARPIIYP